MSLGVGSEVSDAQAIPSMAFSFCRLQILLPACHHVSYRDGNGLNLLPISQPQVNVLLCQDNSS